MADKTTIEWTAGNDGTPGATWNPTRGCSRVSPGCQNCYAERIAARFASEGQPYDGLARRVNGHPAWTNTVRTLPDQLDVPIRWQRPQVAQPRLSEAQIMRLVQVGEEAASRAARSAGVGFIRYENNEPEAQAMIRASVAAVAYAIMDNPAQFTPRTTPEENDR